MTLRAHWAAQRERGSAAGLWLLWRLYRLLGRRAFGLILHPVMAYFWLTGTTARRASRDYLRALRETAARRGVPLPRGLTSYRHIYRFGETVLENMVSWNGGYRPQDVRVDRTEFLRTLAEAGKGAVVIGSHLGRLEMLRAIATTGNRFKVNILAHPDHVRIHHRTLEQINAQAGMNLIPVSGIGLDTAMRLQQRIDAGELVVVLGDRPPVGEAAPVAWAEFLGRPAPFPQGPFILASLLDCPVFLMFALEQPQGLTLHIERFPVPPRLPRKERQAAIQEVVRRYAQRLEHHCLLSPLDWFNLYPFWQAASQDFRANDG